jgi:glycosyltransferase involved in cell wall biosynthesis
MRVALVVAGPYPAQRGSQVLVRHLAEGLGARGHVVRLVTYGAIRADRPGPRPGRIGRNVLLTGRLWRIVRREAIDVIHAHNYEAALAGLIVARATRRPLVYHGHNALVHELPTYFHGALVRRAAGAVGGFLDRHVPRRADFCIAVSEELGSILRSRGVAEHELACIPPAGSPVELGAAPPPARSNGLVCYAGNLDGYQNLDFLLHSFARVRAEVPAARLIIVTHADARAAADRLVRRGAGAGVEVVQAASYEEVRAHLLEADVAVSPRAERSGFPMKLLNYMAAGKAIVASAGSAKGLEDGITARVVPDGDVDAFAAAVTLLLRDAGERARLGAAARRAVESAPAWDGVLDRIETIYRTVLAAYESPPRRLLARPGAA